MARLADDLDIVALAELPEADKDRATPFVGAPQGEVDAWRQCDTQAEGAALAGLRTISRTMPLRPAVPG